MYLREVLLLLPVARARSPLRGRAVLLRGLPRSLRRAPSGRRCPLIPRESPSAFVLNAPCMTIHGLWSGLLKSSGTRRNASASPKKNRKISKRRLLKRVERHSFSLTARRALPPRSSSPLLICRILLKSRLSLLQQHARRAWILPAKRLRLQRGFLRRPRALAQ